MNNERKIKSEDCANCLWYDKCDRAKRCEYYDSVYGNGESAVKEYEENLRERFDDYREIVDEMSGGEYGGY